MLGGLRGNGYVQLRREAIAVTTYEEPFSGSEHILESLLHFSEGFLGIGLVPSTCFESGLILPNSESESYWISALDETTGEMLERHLRYGSDLPLCEEVSAFGLRLASRYTKAIVAGAGVSGACWFS